MSSPPARRIDGHAVVVLEEEAVLLDQVSVEVAAGGVVTCARKKNKGTEGGKQAAGKSKIIQNIRKPKKKRSWVGTKGKRKKTRYLAVLARREVVKFKHVSMQSKMCWVVYTAKEQQTLK